VTLRALPEFQIRICLKLNEAFVDHLPTSCSRLHAPLRSLQRLCMYGPESWMARRPRQAVCPRPSIMMNVSLPSKSRASCRSIALLWVAKKTLRPGLTPSRGIRTPLDRLTTSCVV
jgi:hypothetical protein